MLWAVFAIYQEAITPKDTEIQLQKARMENTQLQEKNKGLTQALSGYRELDKAERTVESIHSRKRKEIEESKAEVERMMRDLADREESIKETLLKSAWLREASLAEIKSAGEEMRTLWETCWAERSAGFPSLAAKYSEAWAVVRKKDIESLRGRAPVTASELRQRLSLEIRKIKASEIVYRNLVDYYERLYPALADLRANGAVATADDVEKIRENGEDWLSAAEWDGLDEAARSQLALDRFCERKKTNWEIGIEYERFCGYRLEEQGWEVDYHGALCGLNDLGRDLVARKRQTSEVLVVQCKYWSQSKQIHEKHVFQTFGTMMALRMDEPEMKVTGVLATLTQLSDRARKFAKALGIVLKEKDELREFPRIKCNAKSMIYHLPFDQMYDQTKIRPPKDFYCLTTQEAEAKGFRRAWKWKG